MKHKLLSTAAVLLLVLLTWSCTATDDEIVQTPATTGTRPAGAQRSLSITIAPKPAFAEAAITLPDGKIGPTTRAVQTEQGTEWEEGDVVWLNAEFESEDALKRINYSALKYSGGAWRYLTEAEADEMGLNDDSKFNRTLSIKDGYKVVSIGGYYVGNGKPDKSGIITIPAPESDDAIPVMQALGIESFQGNSEYWSLTFTYCCSRLRIPAGYGLDMKINGYWESYAPNSNSVVQTAVVHVLLTVADEDRDVFLLPMMDNIGTPAPITLTRNGRAVWTFTPESAGGAEGYYGLSYTLSGWRPEGCKEQNINTYTVRHRKRRNDMREDERKMKKRNRKEAQQQKRIPPYVTVYISAKELECTQMGVNLHTVTGVRSNHGSIKSW